MTIEKLQTEDNAEDHCEDESHWDFNNEFGQEIRQRRVQSRCPLSTKYHTFLQENEVNKMKCSTDS